MATSAKPASAPQPRSKTSSSDEEAVSTAAAAVPVGATAGTGSAVAAPAATVGSSALTGAHPPCTLVRVDYAAVSDRGSRPYNQDTFVLLPDPFDTTTLYANRISEIAPSLQAAQPRPRSWLFAVFDGHGTNGHDVAGYLRDRLPVILRAHQAQVESAELKSVEEGMAAVFSELNHSLLHHSGIDLYMSGSTGAVALLQPHRLVVAHVGDSRIVLGKERQTAGIRRVQALPLTQDHTWTLPTEVHRLPSHARLDRLDADGPLRLFNASLPYPGIVVSRAFGDNVASKLGVIHTPVVDVWPWEPDDAYLIVASDGLWDTVSCKAAVKALSKYELNAVKRSREIVHPAAAPW